LPLITALTRIVPNVGINQHSAQYVLALAVCSHLVLLLSAEGGIAESSVSALVWCYFVLACTLVVLFDVIWCWLIMSSL
jgi:hypothetical protein